MQDINVQGTAETTTDVQVHDAHPGGEWWRSAVIYQIYPRSWADADGNGIGDLPGITARLPYLKALGVDAVWLSPFYPSPQADAGYDVSDYRGVEPLFGRLDDADTLIARSHELGLRVLVDLVPNHTSDEHAWFQAALRAAPGSAERERYIFRDGSGAHGELPPNNWESVFGGAAWTRVTEPDGTPGQWYLHLFDSKQPDLNWQNPQVRSEFEDILRFWLDRGVDGFRVDVAHGLIKADGLPDWSGPLNMLELSGDQTRPPMWDQDGVHEVYRDWHRVLASYPGERAMVAEAWVQPADRAALYVRDDEFQQAFNFEFLQAPWRARDLADAIDRSYLANDAVDAPTTWVLSNHDVVRHASRLGLPVGEPRPNGIGVDDPQPDAALGLRRARAATTLMLALPGGAYLYQGEELGLPEATALPDEVRQDPTFHRTAGREKGRDGCRIPMPWEKDATSYGFGEGDQPWLPQPEAYGDLAVDQQEGDPASTLELYRRLLRVRRDLDLGEGALATVDLGDDVLAYDVTSGSQTVRVIVNFGAQPVQLPADREVLVASEPDIAGQLPTDTAVWLQ
ncbi:glycoside hydrolase family 13 protein [Flexivirga sp. ID2601S]|uniref:Glycoside hydrolase family 13 protein n=1 Tax=Flexivirga aerilata TaxID=1656889 RepID=A0A849AJD9_9MICO|nr:alpha-amylase family glycosyl hydrolase [Flexivirga aerilata]NNG39441.1 glycoside hydrolase family 13 protein [Flexivirga aerilata]